jgi:hypothetical protein
MSEVVERLARFGVNSPWQPGSPRFTVRSMKTPLLMESASTANPADTVKVTRGMLRERAFEVAGLEAPAPQDATKSDWEQANQELMTNPDTETPGEIAFADAPGT